jgi:hypothetical protein
VGRAASEHGARPDEWCDTRHGQELNGEERARRWGRWLFGTHPYLVRQMSDLGLRKTLSKFELWGACKELNFLYLPTRRLYDLAQ